MEIKGPRVGVSLRACCLAAPQPHVMDAGENGEQGHQGEEGRTPGLHIRVAGGVCEEQGQQDELEKGQAFPRTVGCMW